MKINTKYNIGQVVYLLTDEDQKERIITAIMLEGANTAYRLNFAGTQTWHFDFEMTESRDYTKI